MATFNINIDPIKTDEIIRVESIIAEAGFELRIVGGAVRDLIAGQTPKDIDFATDATPDEMIKCFSDAGVKTIPTGIDHGTITAVVNGEPFEITTLRIDTNQDGRHADVEFTTDWQLDAGRRDLTFNALSLKLDGTVFDFFGGATDLLHNVARFVGDPAMRINEDFLRILRFFRFQGRMRKQVWDEATMVAIFQNAGGLAQISGERIWMEMAKILSRPTRVAVLNKMNATGVLDAINLPSKNIDALGDVKNFDPEVAIGVLLDGVGELVALRNVWKFKNKVFNTAKFIIRRKHNSMTLDIAKRLVANPQHKKHEVISLMAVTGNSKLILPLNSWNIPTFPVDGNMLKDKGITPGKEMGAMLAAMRTAWEESNFTLSARELMNDRCK